MFKNKLFLTKLYNVKNTPLIINEVSYINRIYCHLLREFSFLVFFLEDVSIFFLFLGPSNQHLLRKRLARDWALHDLGFEFYVYTVIYRNLNPIETQRSYPKRVLRKLKYKNKEKSKLTKIKRKYEDKVCMTQVILEQGMIKATIFFRIEWRVKSPFVNKW